MEMQVEKVPQKIPGMSSCSGNRLLSNYCTDPVEVEIKWKNILKHTRIF